MDEAGLPGVYAANWFALFAPKSTPKVEVKPVQVQQPTFVQPREIPKETPKVTQVVETAPVETKGEDTSASEAPVVPQEGGQAGGVVGGVTGGVQGGVVGGEVGGTIGGEIGGEKGGVLGGQLGGKVGGTGTGTEGDGTGGKEAPVAPPSGPLRVGGDVKAPTVTKRVQPKYTEAARAARVQGVVILEAIINKNGEVEQVKILSPLPMGLAAEAEAAVKQWRFKPGTLNGTPVDVIFNLTVNFQVGS